MAHIHLEDGAFTIEWVLFWTFVAALLLSIPLYKLGGVKIPTRKLAIAAMCVAVGFAIFQVEIPVLGGVHMNLTPLIGILIGPSLGGLVVLVINIFSAAVGHGGWGMIGPNTIVNLIEVLLGYYVFRMARVRLGAGRFPSGFWAAAIALTVSALAVVAIIAISEIQGSAQPKDQIVSNLVLITAANIVTGIVEGFVTGYVVTFIGRIRPDLLEDAEQGLKDRDKRPEAGAASDV